MSFPLAELRRAETGEPSMHLEAGLQLLIAFPSGNKRSRVCATVRIRLTLLFFLILLTDTSRTTKHFVH